MGVQEHKAEVMADACVTANRLRPLLAPLLSSPSLLSPPRCLGRRCCLR